MDGSNRQIDVSAQIEEIKARMPETYRAIQAKAQEIGNEAFRLVRRGLRGEPNCFYAVERGFVKGAPFKHAQLSAEVAQQIVQFGCGFLVMWRVVEAANVQ